MPVTQRWLTPFGLAAGLALASCAGEGPDAGAGSSAGQFQLRLGIDGVWGESLLGLGGWSTVYGDGSCEDSALLKVWTNPTVMADAHVYFPRFARELPVAQAPLGESVVAWSHAPVRDTLALRYFTGGVASWSQLDPDRSEFVLAGPTGCTIDDETNIVSGCEILQDVRVEFVDSDNGPVPEENGVCFQGAPGLTTGPSGLPLCEMERYAPVLLDCVTLEVVPQPGWE